MVCENTKIEICAIVLIVILVKSLTKALHGCQGLKVLFVLISQIIRPNFANSAIFDELKVVQVTSTPSLKLGLT